MSDIIPTDNSIPPLMGCLAFVPLYKDTRLLAGADDTSIQLDRNEPNIRRLERKLNVLQLIEQNRRFEDVSLEFGDVQYVLFTVFWNLID